jgi:flagellar biosynthesis/type III secretory pathway M-ring protein FliF/YscJ
MNKIKKMWNGLSKRVKIVAGALGAILILIIFSYIV